MIELLRVYDQRAAHARHLARVHLGTGVGVELASVVERYEHERANLLALLHQLRNPLKEAASDDPDR